MERTTKSYKNLNDTLNILLNTSDAKVAYTWQLIQNYQQTRFLARLENTLRLFLNNAVRHSVRERIVCCEDRHIIDVVFSKASQLKVGSKTLMIDGEIKQVPCEIAVFDKLPTLKSMKWWQKQYTIVKRNERLNKVIKQTFRVTTNKMTLCYIPTSQLLLASMSWTVERRSRIGKFVYWTESN